MITSCASINIKNLKLRTYIGFNPEERLKKQDIIINVEIRYRLNKSILNDQFEDALNYKVITKQIIDYVEQGRFLLLEKLTNDVLKLCVEHQSIQQARVTIDKPHALRFADSVSLSLEYDSKQIEIYQLMEQAS